MLEGRVVIVTGGAQGIGAAFCRGLARQGAKVVVADIDDALAHGLADELRDASHDAISQRTDVTRIDSTEEMLAAALRRFGKVDAIVNNAGVWQHPAVARAPVEELSLDEWDRVMDVNLKGVFLCCRAVVPHMKKQGYGKIVNIGSSSVQAGVPGISHYVASKAALIGFSHAIARELGASNITVYVIAPGSTLSLEDPDDSTRARYEQIAANRSLKRIQLPLDIVGAVLFFCSSFSDFITGQTLTVDGGAIMN